MCHAVLHSSSTRGRVALLGVLGDLTPRVSSSCPVLRNKYLLPLAGGLLIEAKGELRAAAGEVLVAVAQQLGEGLQDQLDELPPQVALRVRDYLQLP